MKTSLRAGIRYLPGSEDIFTHRHIVTGYRNLVRADKEMDPQRTRGYIRLYAPRVREESLLGEPLWLRE